MSGNDREFRSANDIIDGQAIPNSGGVPGRSRVKGNGPLDKTPLDHKIDADRARRNGQDVSVDDGGYIDKGNVCDGQPGGECFLADKQRDRLIGDLKLRIQDAGTNFKLAALAVKYDKLLEREADIHPFVGFVLDLAGGWIGLRLTGALMSLRAGGLLKLSESDWWTSRSRTAALSALEATSDDQIKAAVGATMRGAGIQTGIKLKKRENEGLSQDKSDVVELLGLLGTQASFAYTNLREKLPATATDAELIYAWHAFQPGNHLQEQYEAELRAKIERYFASGVQNIRDWNDQYKKHHGGHDDGTYLVQATFMSGFPSQLMFFHGGRSATDEGSDGQGPADGRGDGEQGIKIKDESRGSLSNKPNKNLLVPREFEEVARAKHIAVWGADPRAEFIDDRQWTWDPPRVVKAWENFNKARADVEKRHKGVRP